MPGSVFCVNHARKSAILPADKNFKWRDEARPFNAEDLTRAKVLSTICRYGGEDGQDILQKAVAVLSASLEGGNVTSATWLLDQVLGKAGTSAVIEQNGVTTIKIERSNPLIPTFAQGPTSYAERGEEV